MKRDNIFVIQNLGPFFCVPFSVTVTEGNGLSKKKTKKMMMITMSSFFMCLATVLEE